LSKHFKTDHLSLDIKGRAVRGAAVTLVAQAVTFVVGLGTTMTLARLLTPTDYGIVAMVTALTGLVAVIKDGGLSTATIQQSEITENQISTLFWVNTALGLAACMTVLALSPAVAWFYNNPALTKVTAITSFQFLIGGLTVQHQALLRRQMRFHALAMIQIICLIISVVVGIVMAFCDYRYWSLVAMLITSSLVNCILVWLLSGWRPSWPMRNTGARAMLVFGKDLTINDLFASISGAIDKALLGKFLGAEVAGQYARAQGLLLQQIQQFMPALQTVGLPALSRLKSQSAKYKAAFADLMTITVFASSFIASFMFSAADSLVLFFLGSQWTESVDVFRFFVGPAFTIPISTLCVLSLTSQGESKKILHFGIFNNIVVVVSIIGGLVWGAKGVAAAISISALFVRIPYLYHVLGKVGPNSSRDIWKIVLPGIVLCVISSTTISLTSGMMPPAGLLTKILLVFGLNVLLHGIAALATAWGRNATQVFRSLLTSLKPVRKEQENI
jgi:PST family polysaccharide transporter